MPPTHQPPPTRIVLVDDHVILRQGLCMLFEGHADLAVVGEAAHAREAVEVVGREHPDVVLLDLDLGGEQAADTIPELVAVPGVRVLVLTGVQDAALHRRAVRLGASGVVLKDQAAEVLVKAVRCVHAGEAWIDRGTTATILRELQQGHDTQVNAEGSRIETLTAREREIAALVAQGYGTRKIAESLFIAEKTVRNHLASIYDKLQVSERLELALFAAKHGLVPQPHQPAASGPSRYRDG